MGGARTGARGGGGGGGGGAGAGACDAEAVGVLCVNEAWAVSLRGAEGVVGGAWLARALLVSLDTVAADGDGTDEVEAEEAFEAEVA